MKKRLIFVTAFFATVLLAVAGMLFMSAKKAAPEDFRAEQIVAINELEQLAQSGELEELAIKAERLKEDIRTVQQTPDNSSRFFVLCGIYEPLTSCIFIISASGGWAAFTPHRSAVRSRLSPPQRCAEYFYIDRFIGSGFFVL